MLVQRVLWCSDPLILIDDARSPHPFRGRRVVGGQDSMASVHLGGTPR